MTAKGYTTKLKVALLLGTEGYAALSINQADRMDNGLIEAAEQYIDSYTGRSWLDGGTVVAERRCIENGRIWLKHRPITAVSAVRYAPMFCAATTLTATTDYLVETARGLVTLRGYRRGDAEVDYTVPQTVPADVSEAAGLIVAGWIQRQQSGVGADGIYKSIEVDGLKLAYRDQVTLTEIPATAEKLLSRYCRPVLA